MVVVGPGCSAGPHHVTVSRRAFAASVSCPRNRQFAMLYLVVAKPVQESAANAGQDRSGEQSGTGQICLG